MSDPWTTMYRWQWFHREQWLGTFRVQKAASPRALRDAMGQAGGKVLDCSCGLGLKTIVMKDLGLDVTGSDGCEYAVEKARELSVELGLEIPFFHSSWAGLADATNERFDAVFNDALCWSQSTEEFLAAIVGIRGVLKPGGFLMFFGAPEGSPAGSGVQVMRDKLAQRPAFGIEWTHRHGAVGVTCIAARELHADYLDEHHLYLIDEPQGQRLETATIRQTAIFDWPVIKDLFARAGYSRLDTRSFDQVGAKFTMNIATR